MVPSSVISTKTSTLHTKKAAELCNCGDFSGEDAYTIICFVDLPSKLQKLQPIRGGTTAFLIATEVWQNNNCIYLLINYNYS